MQTTAYLKGIAHRARARLSGATEPDMDAWDDLWENLDYYRIYDTEVSVTLRAPLLNTGFGSVGWTGRTKTYTGTLAEVEFKESHFDVMAGDVIDTPRIRFPADEHGNFFTIQRDVSRSRDAFDLGGVFGPNQDLKLVDIEVSTDA